MVDCSRLFDNDLPDGSVLSFIWSYFDLTWSNYISEVIRLEVCILAGGLFHCNFVYI